VTSLRLLITRPEPDAQGTAASLRALGHEVLVMPLLRIEPVGDADFGPESWAAIVMTSANAARAVAVHRRFSALRAVPSFVVGERTREVAQAVGFADVTSAGGNAAALARLVRARLSPDAGPLLYLAGEQRGTELESALRDFALRAVAVYRAVALTELSQGVKAALVAGEIDGILHFSRRSADAFVVAAEAAGALHNALAARHYCLSAQVAAAFADKPAARIQVAAQPDEQALIALVTLAQC
jgi:uroporphyrinogen-III synthase